MELPYAISVSPSSRDADNETQKPQLSETCVSVRHDEYVRLKKLVESYDQRLSPELLNLVWRMDRALMEDPEVQRRAVLAARRLYPTAGGTELEIEFDRGAGIEAVNGGVWVRGWALVIDKHLEASESGET